MIFGPYILDIQKRIPLVVPLSQNDKGNSLVFSLYSGSERYEMTSGSVTLSGRKPSGKVFSYSGTREGNVATFTIDEQMTAEAGQVLCEVVHSASGVRKGSANFILDCERDPLTDGDVSETDLSVMQEAIDAAAELRDGLSDLNAIEGQISALSNSAYLERGILPSGTDLNTVTECGTYQLNSGHANLPSGITEGNLLVFTSGSGRLSQMCIGGNGFTWVRAYSTAWDSWRALYYRSQVDMSGSYESGIWADTPSPNTCVVRRCGDMVTLTYNLRATAAHTDAMDHLWFILPAGYRPPAVHMYMAVAQGATASTFQTPIVYIINITASGAVNINFLGKSPAVAAFYRNSISWPVNY